LTELPETKEERFAERFSKLNGLVPPVDVIAVAKSVAQFQEKTFPVGIKIDGLCLDLKRAGTRPRIWINRSSSYHRKRFTIAHEIGHVTIPWHLGNIVDDLDADTQGHNSAYRQVESEANRFAAELLMPRQWAETICSRVEHMRGAMLTVAQVADVSLHAAALRVLQLGPPGYVMSAVQDGRITWVGQTKGTKSRLPKSGGLVSQVNMPAFGEPEVYGNAMVSYYWWKERDTIGVPPMPEGDWRSILEYMLLSVPPERQSLARSKVNAIVGYRIGKFPRGTSADVMYKEILKRVQNNTDRDRDVRTIVSHPDFTKYVLARIYDRSNSK
jgi:Zn-dependent peptidase ImmA (M78 family)